MCDMLNFKTAIWIRHDNVSLRSSVWMMLFYFAVTTKVQRNLPQKLISTGIIIAINIAQKERWAIRLYRIWLNVEVWRMMSLLLETMTERPLNVNIYPILKLLNNPLKHFRFSENSAILSSTSTWLCSLHTI